MTRRPRTPGVIAGLPLLIALLTLALAPAAQAAGPIAQAKARAADLQRRIGALNRRLQGMAARYDATAASLATVNGRIQTNERRLREARARESLARAQLAQRAVAMYKAPDTGLLAVALTDRSLEELWGDVHTAKTIYAQGATMIREIKASEREIRVRGAALTAQKAQAQTLLAQIGEQRTQIAGEIKKGETLLAQVKSRVKTLVKQAAARRR